MPSFVATTTLLLDRRKRFLSTCNHSPRRLGTTARLVPLSTDVQMEVIDNPPYPLCTDSPPKSPSPSFPLEKAPLLFIHGSLHAAWCFHLFQSFFASHGFQTFAVSLRRAGNTACDDETVPTIHDHISDLNSLLQQLNLQQPPILIGHSMGGFVAQKWVELEKSFKPLRMVLLASTPPTGTSGMAWRITRQLGVMKSFRLTMGFIRKTPANSVDACREMFFSSKDSEGFSEEIEGDDKLKEYMEQIKLTNQTMDTKSLKKHVKEPGDMKGKVLVVGAELDCLVDRQGLEETAELWGAQLHILENAPHDLMLYSRWKDAANIVLDWINVESQNAQTPLEKTKFKSG